MKLNAFRLILLMRALVLLAVYVIAEHQADYKLYEKSESIAADNKSHHDLSDPKLYSELFKRKRLEQANAIKLIRTLKDVKKQRSTIKLLLDNIRKVLIESKIVVDGAKQLTKAEIFKDVNLRNHISRILENIAFLGEITLFFPDYVEKLFRKDEQYKSIFSWSYELSTKLDLCDLKTNEMLRLAGQELHLVERDDNYTNPNRADALKEAAIRVAMVELKRLKDKKRAAAGDAKIKRQKERHMHGEL